MPYQVKVSDGISALALLVAAGTWYFGLHQQWTQADEERRRVYRGSFEIGSTYGDVFSHILHASPSDSKDDDARAHTQTLRLLPLVRAMGLDFDPTAYRYHDISQDPSNLSQPLYESLQLLYNDPVAVTAFALGADLAELCDAPALRSHVTRYPAAATSINQNLVQLGSGCDPLDPTAIAAGTVDGRITRLHYCLESELTIKHKKSVGQRIETAALAALAPRRSVQTAAAANVSSSVYKTGWCTLDAGDALP